MRGSRFFSWFLLCCSVEVEKEQEEHVVSVRGESIESCDVDEGIDREIVESVSIKEVVDLEHSLQSSSLSLDELESIILQMRCLSWVDDENEIGLLADIAILLI